jgi:uncharacterized protein (TIGR00369 family)
MQNKIHDTNEISLLERYNASNNFGKLLNIDFKIISDGVVEYYLKIEQKHLATPQAAHGGVVAALVDSALGVAGLSAVYKERKAVSTVEFKLNYLSPALLNDELIATHIFFRPNSNWNRCYQYSYWGRYYAFTRITQCSRAQFDGC